MAGFDNGSQQGGVFFQAKQFGAILRGFGPPVPQAGVMGDLYIDVQTWQLFNKRSTTASDDIDPWGHYLFVVPLAYRTALKWFNSYPPTNDIGQIGDYCIIGHPAGGHWAQKPVHIRRGSTIRSHSVIYQGSEFGPVLETGHHALIREGTIAGQNLRVGSFSDIEGDCEIGDFCRFHGYTHVGRGSKIGHLVWLYSLTTLTNDPLPPSEAEAPVTIEDGVVVCVGAIVMPGEILRRGSFVCAQAMASGDVPPGAVVSGPNGQILTHVSRLMSPQYGLQHPWMGHYRRGYPPEALARISALKEAIITDRDAFMQRYMSKG